MKAIIQMITGTFCSRILGLLRDIVFFAILGSSMEASAFLIAFAIPNLFRRLCGEGALNSAFVPVFAQRYVKHPETAHIFLNAFFSRISIYLFISIFIFMLTLACMDPFISDSKWTTVIYLTNAMLPYLWFICIAALFNGALNVLDAFSLTAFSPVFLNLSMLTGLGLCTFAQAPMQQVIIVSISVVIGGAIQWLLPKLQLKKLGFPLNRFIWEKDKDLTHIWHLFIPSVFGAAIFQINTLLGRFLAFHTDAEAVSYLYLANRFLELPLGLFAFAIISVLLPKLSFAEAQNKLQQSGAILKNCFELLLLLLLPAGCALYVLAEPILQLFFCWGRFSLKDVDAVVPLLKLFAIGLPLFGVSSLLTRVFYAHKDTHTPVKLSCYTLIFYLVIALVLMPYIKIKGLVWASILSTGIQFLLQWHLIKNRYTHYSLRYTWILGKKWICLSLFTYCLYIHCNTCDWNLPKLSAALQLLKLIGIHSAFYFILLALFDKKSFKKLIALRTE